MLIFSFHVIFWGGSTTQYKHQVVSVDGEHSEIAETSCGTSVMAVGSTVYELSGDGALGTRSLEAVEMSAGDDCSITGVPSTADCYS